MYFKKKFTPKTLVKDFLTFIIYPNKVMRERERER